MIQNIVEGFQKIFADASLELEEVYNVDKVVDGDGILILQTNSIEKLNPQLEDYKITFIVSGQTYIDNDPTREKIQRLFVESNKILTGLTAGELKNITGEFVVGYIFKQAEMMEEESTRGFGSQFEVYVCDFKL